MARQTKAEKELDKEIERCYYKHCNGKPINILDIPKVFQRGKDARASGQDVEQAVIAAIAEFCH